MCFFNIFLYVIIIIIIYKFYFKVIVQILNMPKLMGLFSCWESNDFSNGIVKSLRSHCPSTAPIHHLKSRYGSEVDWCCYLIQSPNSKIPLSHQVTCYCMCFILLLKFRPWFSINSFNFYFLFFSEFFWAEAYA